MMTIVKMTTTWIHDETRHQFNKGMYIMYIYIYIHVQKNILLIPNLKL